MDLEKVYKIIEKEPAFRKKQINKLIFQDLISNWSEATTLPLSLREELNEKPPLGIAVEKFVSKDWRTIKAVITLNDGLKIEAVLMKYGERNTVCVSSEVGCPLGCIFCATGKIGFKRNLSVSEILEQVLFFGRELKEWIPDSTSCFRNDEGTSRGDKGKVTNIVFMGMGEPFLNYENVLGAIRVINDKEKFRLGARHISISTSGIIPGIERFTEENLEVNLAISLHAPNDLLRSKLMPVNNKYSLVNLLVAVSKYVNRTRRKVMFEYILLEGVNDSEKEAEELSKILKHPLFMVNLIKYNETGRTSRYIPSGRKSQYIPSGDFKASSLERINKFKRVLSKNRIPFTERMSLGGEIKGACGQLIGES